jgi:hypothetical protein
MEGLLYFGPARWVRRSPAREHRERAAETIRQAALGPRPHALLQTYIAHFLPFFAADSTDFADKHWLFPSGDGRPGPVSIGRGSEAVIAW